MTHHGHKSLLLLAGADADLSAFEHLSGGERSEFMSLMPEGIDEEKDLQNASHHSKLVDEWRETIKSKLPVPSMQAETY